MNEQKRMEEFYDKYKYAKEFRVFLVWDKDEDDEYIAPLPQLLWAGWQAAQHGQRSFDFGNEGKSEFFGDK
jgi:hypothetical protein